ncbi:prolipoprotein diacylglyceryl transferase [Acholeplasma equirhinis]|uniref:prolipoprotein diacylglyceryl transferase n=1 Tax=Acholeplasma equirhinis TaxID=555393 RepID=UPI00197A7626|nr:prolipoprotein diacylglyceryl transferase family protein [Acholeplasma equirhinis]MBN3490772.1 prolipoprotein diacylglyceryl transferase [Acholeplasma equirhinis]
MMKEGDTMYPYMFGIEGFETYYVLIIIGVFFSLAAFRMVMKYYKVEVDVYEFYLKLILVSMVVGFIFAFLFQQLYNLIDALEKGREYQAQGMTLMGGVVGGITVWLIGSKFFAPEKAKAKFFHVTNVAIFSVMIGQTFGRIGCVMAGCCFGIDTDEWYGMTFHTHDHAVVPTQLFEAIFVGLLVLVGIYLIRKMKINYMVFLYFIAYPIFRFFIEYFRGDERGTFLPLFSPSQWQSVGMFAVATLLLVRYIKNPFDTRFKGFDLAENN